MARINKIDEHIEDRARLMFVFTQNGKKLVRVLNFFENIQIREAQRSNLVEYNPLSRAGSLFSYTGAESRKLTLTFNLTLPNILLAANRQYKKFSGKDSKEKLQRRFFERVLDEANGPTTFFSQAHDTTDYDFFYKLRALTDSEFREYQKYITEKDSPLYGEYSERTRGIDTIVYWTNLIRSSVVNNATNPLNGPPIVRINYGTLYRDIPCICRSYSIEANDSAGYDVKTLLPRVIAVQMELQELRTGNFGEFKYGKPVERDNLTGWESITHPEIGSMDPGDLDLRTSIIGTIDTVLQSLIPERARGDL